MASPSDEAASIPIVFLTSWFALRNVANLKEGETTLIQSAGSGVGMAGIQIAKHMGCRVITTAGSQEKLDKARELGADHCIDYTETDFLAETMSITDRAGVDVVLEAVGGEVLTKSIQALAMGGRAVTVGNTSRQPATVEPGLMLNRLLTLKGFSLAVQMGSGGVMQELQAILDLLAQGKLRTVIDRVFPLSEAGNAHRHLGDRRNFGKVLLRP